MGNAFQGKSAVITGGANGIGYGIAEEFCARGGKVVLADILADDLHKSVEKLKGEGREAAGFEIDVSKEDQWPGLLEAAQGTFGTVDYLFNNAGIMYTKPYDSFVAADWEWYLKVNVMGVVYGCNTFYPAMAEQGGGHICTTVSQAALGPLAGPLIGAPYAPSKAACLTFMEQFAIMMRERENGITCSAIMPSIVNTDIGFRLANPLVRPEELRDNPDINNLKPEVAQGMLAMIKRLSDPQTPEDKQTAWAMGVISVQDAAKTILDGIEKGWFYIYTHPGRSRAINVKEADLRISGYKQPVSQGDASAEYVKLSGSAI